ncbi:predicted protein, partial [Nematostella vectensis]
TMEMMARILGDMSSYTVQEELYFDLDAFIESKPSEDQPFYRELCKTHAFSSFLDSRLLHPEKRDYFAAEPELKSSSLLASYLYLRGMFNVARGNKIEALEDFFAVSTWNVQLFPHE